MKIINFFFLKHINHKPISYITKFHYFIASSSDFMNKKQSSNTYIILGSDGRPIPTGTVISLPLSRSRAMSVSNSARRWSETRLIL